MKRTLPCAEALHHATQAANLADWKQTGPVAESARKAAERATEAALLARLQYHRVSIQ
jgi:hypothetical protein